MKPTTKPKIKDTNIIQRFKNERILKNRFGKIGPGIYYLIDGKKNCERLANEMGIKIEEVFLILEFMLSEGLIEVTTPTSEERNDTTEKPPLRVVKTVEASKLVKNEIWASTVAKYRQEGIRVFSSIDEKRNNYQIAEMCKLPVEKVDEILNFLKERRYIIFEEEAPKEEKVEKVEERPPSLEALPVQPLPKPKEEPTKVLPPEAPQPALPKEPKEKVKPLPPKGIVIPIKIPKKQNINDAERKKIEEDIISKYGEIAKKLIEEIDNNKNTHEIADACNISMREVNRILGLLEESRYIRFERK